MFKIKLIYIKLKKLRLEIFRLAQAKAAGTSETLESVTVALRDIVAVNNSL
jgi:hypothetical protein